MRRRVRRSTSPLARAIVIAVATIGLLAAGTSPAGAGSDGAKARKAATANVARHVDRALAFRDPPTISSHDGQLRETLDARSGPVDISGATISGRTYDEGFVGPTLVVKPGDLLDLTTRNHLREMTNLHTHGLFVSPAGNSDNVFVMVSGGATFENVYQLSDDVSPGTYWYHSHAHPLAEGQVFGGMSGVLIVEGLRDLLPANLQHLREHVFALKDFQVDPGGRIPSENIDSDAPTIRTVNGLVDPRLTMRPGETQLWRLANIGADIWYQLHVDGMQFHVIGEDANPVSEVTAADELLLPPGKRYDVLVQAPEQPGRLTLETLQYSTGPAGDTYPRRELASVAVKGARQPLLDMPTSLAPLDDLRNDPIAQERTFDFSEDDQTNQFFINGQQFDPNRVDAPAMLGTTEEWTVTNSSQEQHPFHIHVNDIQVISVNGEPYDAKSWQDTVVLPVGGSVVMRMRFRDYTGQYVFHCHILAHEDNGMMAVVNVS
jgi:FtsP/CotA-like multicopper oxidase with cupredoxin domain